MPYTHLTAQERYCIAHMHMHKMSLRTIASRLSRSPSTISRELKRNTPPHAVYWYESAESLSQQRKVKPRTQNETMRETMGSDSIEKIHLIKFI